jgi:hypothetical protein
MDHLDRIAGTLRRMLPIMLLVAAPAIAAGSVSLQRPTLLPSAETGKFGGAVHDGAASLELTAALLQAGGGPEKFSIHAALVDLVGEAAADQELAKLQHQYGEPAVRSWQRISDWMVTQGLVQLRNVGTELPSPPHDLDGGKLAAALVDAGVAPGDSAFWSSYWYDRLFSHGINKVLEEDVGRRFGEHRARSAYAVNNQVMYDISQSVHAQDVRLATLH